MITVCRLCLKDGIETDSASDYSESGTEDSAEISFEQLVLHYLPIEIIKEEDTLYPYICNDCRSSIKRWHRFCTSCINNDKIYQEMLLGQLDHDDRTMDNHDPFLPIKEENSDSSCDDTRTLNQYLQIEPVDVNEEAGDDISNSPRDTLELEDQAQKSKEEIDRTSEAENFKFSTNHSNHSLEKAGESNGNTLQDSTVPKKIGRPRIKPLGQKYVARTEMCSICGKFVVALKEHLRVHNDDRRYKCSYCPKSFVAKRNYVSHVNIHTRAVMYKCDQCDKEYAQKNGLKAHLATHSKVRKYACTVCEKTYYQRTALSRHKRSHFEEPKVKCPECDHMFYSNGEMKQHFRKHLPDKPFVCEICDRAFYRKSNLKTHMKTHRKKIPDASADENLFQDAYVEEC